MKHSVYERDKLSNKEQIESAVSGNIKGWLEPKQRHTMLWRDSTKQHTCSVAWILSGVSSKMSLVSSGQNITMSSVHGLCSSNMVIQIQRLQPSSCPLHYHFYCFSPPPDWLALTLIMPCTLDHSDNQVVEIVSDFLGKSQNLWSNDKSIKCQMWIPFCDFCQRKMHAWKNPSYSLNVAWLLMRLSAVGLGNIRSWRKQ